MCFSVMGTVIKWGRKEMGRKEERKGKERKGMGRKEERKGKEWEGREREEGRTREEGIRNNMIYYNFINNYIKQES